jgi:hypothetical protein
MRFLNNLFLSAALALSLAGCEKPRSAISRNTINISRDALIAIDLETGRTLPLGEGEYSTYKKLKSGEISQESQIGKVIESDIKRAKKEGADLIPGYFNSSFLPQENVGNFALRAGADGEGNLYSSNLYTMKTLEGNTYNLEIRRYRKDPKNFKVVYEITTNQK